MKVWKKKPFTTKRWKKKRKKVNNIESHKRKSIFEKKREKKTLVVDFSLETQKDENFNNFFWDTRDPLVSGNMVPRSCLIKQVGEKTDGKIQNKHNENNEK